MLKIFRILGKRGRVTIPFEIRQIVGFAYNDVLSFTVSSENEVTVKREKICDNCCDIGGEDRGGVALADFLDGLSSEMRKDALIYLLRKEDDAK